MYGDSICYCFAIQHFNLIERKYNMSNDVFVVMDGTRLAGVYRYREDASSHAQACGGNFIVQSVRNEIPGWVQTMIDAAKKKAQMQNSVKR